VIKPPAKLLEDAIFQIKNRRVAIVKELREIDRALDRYGIDPRRLANANGRTLAQGGNGTSPPAVATAGAGVVTRCRRAAPSLEWLVGELNSGKHSQSELTRRATASGYSATAMVVLLKGNSRNFKSEPAPKKAGTRGKPGQIWSLRG